MLTILAVLLFGGLFGTATFEELIGKKEKFVGRPGTYTDGIVLNQGEVLKEKVSFLVVTYQPIPVSAETGIVPDDQVVIVRCLVDGTRDVKVGSIITAGGRLRRVKVEEPEERVLHFLDAEEVRVTGEVVDTPSQDFAELTRLIAERIKKDRKAYGLLFLLPLLPLVPITP